MSSVSAPVGPLRVPPSSSSVAASPVVAGRATSTADRSRPRTLLVPDHDEQHKAMTMAAATKVQGQSSTVTLSPSLTSASTEIFTPPPSDTSAGLDGPTCRKRTADGAVKSHSRTTSAVSQASTSNSIVSDMSAADMKTRLSYAMVKYNNGWQSRSLGEIESLVSQQVALSPVNRPPRASPISPSSRPPPASTTSATTTLLHLASSYSPPPSLSPGHATLAPPAPIRAASSSVPNPRRNSTPRHHTTPGIPARASPQTPRPVSRPDVGQPPMSRTEQDVAESLLFMSSPGNSANIKQPPSTSRAGRHALPSGPRKALPTQRPSNGKAATTTTSPGSPMDVDPPSRPTRPWPNRGGGNLRRRAGGVGSSLAIRSLIPLPVGLDIGRGAARMPLQDKDIERMLDEFCSKSSESSDDDEIILPRRDMAEKAMQVKSAATSTPGL
ncbi:hypothetical protein L249_0732 [Ophiocordyceps polyrhachis-furcata BCC 54312]|uniref:Uncharacterized protein n=1 Tax=Ophiocordyceps polyrhachis-furcata BCC 54312 TaxID=1330021 RepID=A0A367LCC9_9HYPO|nr:hypothetical protein L249_0732 [Ophiocordyceps polyrhachis-furcata BCC 54312]